MFNNDRSPQPPEKSAEELTELARQADDPGARVWYLEWARAFDRLAELGGRKGKKRPKAN